MMKRFTALVVALAMVISLVPATALNVLAVENSTEIDGVTNTAVADGGTAHTWESMMGTANDGNRYAGRVWADKSVFTDGQTAMLDSQGNNYKVDLNADEAFQVIFSVLGSSMTTTSTSSSIRPMDVVLVLDTSTSMSWDADGQTRLERTITAANKLLTDLLTIPSLRLSIVTYNADSETVLPLDFYTNGVKLSTNSYTNTNGGGIISAYDKDNKLLGKDDGYHQGTNLQSGIDRGFQILADATNVSGRIPVAIVLTDGEANRAVRNNWYNVPSGSVHNSGTTGLALSTLLNAAYKKVCIEKNYGRSPMIYGVGVELSEGGLGRALMDPGDADDGFNANNSSNSVRTAYSLFQQWAKGEDVTSGSGNRTWTFDHNMPSSPAVTTAEVAANINYIDKYFSVTSAGLGVTFTKIYEELSTSAFNPIADTTTESGGTGVKDTPLVYVDTLGKYMQIKRIQNVTLFGSSYAVVKNSDGTYTVTEGTGVNPTTEENYNTAEAIQISVTENADGTQTLRVEIDQEILPILLEKVLSKTEDGVTTTTIEEIIQQPLRVFYTVGLSDTIVTDGKLDVSKIEEGYAHMDVENGKIHFYSNAFGVRNKTDADGDGLVDEGDAHIGFKPSAANRFYYHQLNQGIFSKVSTTDNSKINWEADEYGVLYNKDIHELTYLSYADYQSLKDTDTVYTYVNYIRPTVDTSDAANAAEKVTYLIYAEWGYMKESVAFYDRTARVYVNYDATNGYTTGDKGYVIPADKVAATINAYVQANPGAKMQAVLGIGSVRTSRLHNMIVEKTENTTGTAELRYNPEYTYETAADHSGNDVVIWLGNNGKLTMSWDPNQQLTIGKTWNDAENQDGIRPDTVTVHLTAINSLGATTTQQIVLSASESWTKTIKVPVRDAEGYTLTYTLTEEAVEGYTAVIHKSEGDGTITFSIENSHTPATTNISVLKSWDDADNQDGIRPTSVEVELYADGHATGKIALLSASNHWAYTWENLPVNAAGKKIEYTVVERNVPNGYVSSVVPDGELGVLEVINSHEVEKTEVSVNKVWNDQNNQDGIRPGSVEVELYADGSATGKKLTLNAGNGWKGTFQNLDKNSNGTPVVYTVREVSTPAGYSVVVSGSATEGFTITNTHQVEKTTITVNKVWNDANNQDGKRPVSITVNLYANGSKIDTQVLSAATNWSYTWTGLDKNANGSAIVYTVDETPVDGYTAAVDGLTITNTHEVEKTEITTSKVWNDHDDQDGKRPGSVTVHLLADGDHTGKKIVLSAENGWKYTWTDLDKYADGKLISYTVYEETVEGYTTTYGWDPVDATHAIITNTYSPEKTVLNVQKQWADNHNQDGIRPNSVVLELYANGTATGKKLVLSDENHWAGSFTALDKYADGVQISYTVKEAAVAGYTSSVSVDGATGLVTVINTHIPETVNVSVNKVWVDNNNQDGIRPDSVVLELYANGTTTGKTVTVNAAGNWKAVFTGMPKYAGGVEVIYTVQEVNVPAGYTASASGTTVTNTHIPETISITVNKVWVDNNNQDNLRPESVTVNLYANGALYATAEMNKGNLHTVTFENLPKFANGHEIAYTVEEANVPAGYVVSYSGSVDAGFVITNTHEVYKTQISTSKVWNDANNQDGKRPASITVHLLADGVHTGEEVVLSAENGWAHTWTGLDMNRNGTEIDYTVYEEPVAGYTTGYQRDPGDDTHVIITNSYTPEKTSLDVQKVWIDNNNQDGIRPNGVEVELYANGTATGIKAALSAGNGWSYSFTDLDKFSGGVAIKYTVVELTKAPGYEVTYKADSVADLYEVINTHIPEKVDVPVVKVWNDADNQDGIRPGSVTVELYANGKATGQKLVLNASNSWKGTFAGLDKNSDGNAIVYTVREVNVPNGYTAAVSGSVAGGFTVTNTHQVEKTDITVSKIWNDKNNQDGKRPVSITVNLYANGEKIATQILDASTNWSYTWTGLDKNANGSAIVYTVDEAPVDGYTASVEGLTITNTHEVEKTQVSVNKVWDDVDNQDGKRPASVTVHLLANGDHTGQKVVLSAENGWKHTWTGLDKYQSGAVILYTVYEEPVAGYTASYERDSANHITVTNSYDPEKTGLSVQKIWVDNDNQDGIRPGSVEVELYANGVATGIKATLSASNNWLHNFTGLDKFQGGKEVKYTVVELTALAGYEVSYKVDSETGLYEIVNTHKVEKTEVSVNKVWNDQNNQDGKRPLFVIANLYANGELIDAQILDGANSWTWTWTELDVNANGTPIVYTVDEDPVAYYTAAITGNASEGFTITNTHEVEKTEVPVNKIWNDRNDQDGIRPGIIEVELYANGIATGKKLILNTANEWKGIFTDLDVNSNGTKIIYTVKESAVSGYTETITGNAAEGFTITNTHEVEKTAITVNKVWNDQNNQDGKRPTTIIVNLYANGEKIATQILDASMNWSYTWTGLDKNANGSAIVYTVDEAPVEGYTAAVDGLTITNTHEVEKTELSVNKVWNDANNQDGKRPASITVHLLANGEHTGEKVVLSAENGWAHSWTNLDKYHNGTEILYTVYEEPVTGYTTGYQRDPSNNTHVIITNSYTPEKTGLNIQKVWIDNDNQDGIRPNGVEVELYANGTATGIKVILNAANNWKHSFTGLDKYAEGVPVVYTAVELTVTPGYEVSYKVDGETGLYEIINTHQVEKTEVSVNKVWNDRNNQDGIRPDAVEVELYADGLATGKKLVLNTANEWKATFTDLDKYSNGTPVVYTVREVNVPSGYVAAVTGSAAEGFTVTNTHEVEKTAITVNKVWNDANNQDGKRPTSITVNLYANGEKIATQTIDASMSWSYTWTDLDVNANGNPITYTVAEVPVDGYTATVDGLTITNTHEVEKTEISVNKQWDDADDQDGKRPVSITVHLLANGAHTGEKVVLSAENGWAHSWKGLDKYHNGTEVLYTVYEEPVDGYTASYVRDSANNITVTNSYDPEKTGLNIQKVWIDNDNQDGIRPDSIEVELYANGVATGIKVTLSVANNWTHSFTGLDKFQDGVPVKYTAVELTVTSGYEVSYEVDSETGLYEIVNTHKLEKTQVSVNKIWNDRNNQDGIRPGSVEVELYADGLATGKKLMLNASNSWMGTFTDLDKYSNGTPVVYTVREVSAFNGYSVVVSGNAAEGFTITNTHQVEKTDITVNKVWNDQNNQDGKRPTSIIVNLYANGEKIATQILDASMNWSYTWTGLDKNANGSAIVYTVDEAPVEGYTVTVDGLTITNTHEVEKTEISVSKQWNDANNQDGKRPASITVHLLANGEHTGEKIVLSAENGWKHIWTNLDKYHNGTEVLYTVYEEPVTGYTTGYQRDPSNNTHVIITNSYTPEKTGLNIQKVWIDNDNQDGIRPNGVEVELYANGTATGIKVILNAANNWKHSFTGLDKFQNGELVQYTVVELTKTQGYEVSYKVDSETGLYEIINTHKVEKTEVSVNKVWNDRNNQDGKRPASVVVELYADGIATGKTMTITAPNGWKGTFTDLDKYSNGTPVVYTVREVHVSTGYVATVTGSAAEGFTITNTHEVDKTEVSVNKVWNDQGNQDGKRPATITVELYANGEKIATQAIDASMNWNYTWTDLDVNANGEKIVYTVKEAAVSGYSTVITGNANEGFTITNTHEVEKTDITVNKVWNDQGNQDGKRPASITVNLYANGNKIDTQILDASMNWSYTWTDLDMNANGSAIVYTVDEISVDGYTATVDGLTITNTHKVEKTEVSVNKQWDDANNQDGKRPASITVHLLANGEHTGEKIVLSAENGWKHTWTNLDKYHNGTEILYTVYEEPVDGYTASYERDSANNITVTNSYDPEKTGLNIQKVWVDNDDQDGIRPDSIEVELYANGVATGIKVTLSAANNWTHSFTGLDKFQDGEVVKYTVVELAQTQGYEVSYKVDSETGLYEIINTHKVEKTEVSVNKVWNDQGNQDGKRPAAITVELYANGEKITSQTLNASNNWSYTWTGLDVNANGEKIVYTVKETAVAGYTSTVSGSAAEGFTITNTHEVEKTDITVNKIWKDQNDQDGKRPASITVNLYANGNKIDTQILDASMNWSYTWTGLDKNANGSAIVYTVDEVPVDGYITTIDGMTITNTYDVEKTEISVSKQWDDQNDQDGKRPTSITVHLLADGEHTGLTKELNEANGWKAAWTGLDKYADGELINYTVHETPVEGYYTTYIRDSADQDHIIITNTYSVDKTSFTVLKVWHDDHNRDGLRRDVEVELYANGVATGLIVTLTEANHWTYTFENLDKNAGGKPIDYVAVELTKLEGYTTTYTFDGKTGIFEIVNSHETATTEISVNKVWDDSNDQDGMRPAWIEVTLLADGDDTGKKVILSAENDWTYTWTGLHKYHNGKAIVYTVLETATKGYEAEYTREGNTITITNHHAEQKVEISAFKQWNDGDNRYGKRPDKVEIVLVVNGTVTDKVLVLNEQNNWYGEWTDLPKYENGKLINYTVREVAVAEGYVSTVAPRAENAYAFVVTNEYIPEKTTLTATKVWYDHDDEYKLRPVQIVLALLANGEVVEEVVFSESNGWTHTWTDLPVEVNGETITYTVKEVTVDENYGVSYIANEGENGEVLWTVINTLIEDNPDTGDAIEAMFMLMIVSLTGVLLLTPAVIKKKRRVQ